MEFEITVLLQAAPEEIYNAWLSSEGHSAMTGGSSAVSADVGAEFRAWDGYIRGRNLELEYGRRIVQSWRTTEFSSDEADSRIEISLEPAGDQTKLILRHTGLPPHGMKYKQGWMEAYFDPMLEYFKNRRQP